MDKITAFIMTHPDVTIEIKKDANFYQSINIKMRRNKTTYRKIIDEDRLTALESTLIYMYNVVSNEEENFEQFGRIVGDTENEQRRSNNLERN